MEETPKICCLYVSHRDEFRAKFKRLRNRKIDFYCVKPDWDRLSEKYSDYWFKSEFVPKDRKIDTPKYVGNGIFVTIDFREKHPEYDYYFFMEYDDHYTGNINRLFSKLIRNLSEYDCLIQSEFVQDGNWYWIRHPHHVECEEDIRRQWYQFYCLSGRTIDLIFEEYKKGCYGHYELVMTYVLWHYGLKYDLLTNYTDTCMKVSERWMPKLLKPNTMYHPIKDCHVRLVNCEKDVLIKKIRERIFHC